MSRTGDLRLIPEYEPVERLCLSFVQDFFNTRFGYGRTICEIIKAVRRRVQTEVWVSDADLPFLMAECAREHLGWKDFDLRFDSPGRGIVAEYVPIFARQEGGEAVGLIFNNPRLEEEAEGLKEFSKRFAQRMGFGLLETGIDFATAHLLVNEDLVLLSEYFFQGEEGKARLRFFEQNFPTHTFRVVPPLAGDVTEDLDMYLWAIAPRQWIVSEYQRGTPQADSIEPALRVLKEHGHTVHRVPGLEAIIYDDVNTMPNYANGVMVNGLALVPAYGREEDGVVVKIVERLGLKALPIDCSQVILSNSAIHCITKTVPVK